VTFSQLARNNVRGSRQRYLAYFLSCVFSVATFYILLSFITHPAVLTGQIVGGERESVERGLLACEIVIVLFSLLFILYSTTAFIRSRKKEFGLLTLLGMTQRQLREMVSQESRVIALGALGAGLILGILLSKLFFMAMAVLLEVENPIPFAVPPLAILGTVAAFLGLFLLTNLVSMLGVRESSIQELLKAHRRPKLPPRRQPFLLILGLGLLAWGYRLAWVTDGRTLGRNMVPILGLTIAGTYFVVTRGSVLVCGWLRRCPRVYLRGTNVLVINRLAYRLVDNARALFISAILVAIVGTSLGAFNSLLQSARSVAIEDCAYSLSYVIPPGTDAAAAREETLAALRERGLDHVESQAIEAFKTVAEIGEGRQGVTVVPSSSYSRAAEVTTGFDPVILAPGQSLLVLPYEPEETSPEVEAASITDGGRTTRLQVVGSVTRRWLPGGFALVVCDSDYPDLAGRADPAARFTFLGFEYRGWERSRDLGEALWSALRDSKAEFTMDRYADYRSLRQAGALTMFVGVFVSFVFFIAAGSLIYFKVFTEIGEDRAQHVILREIGITRREFTRVVSQELGALFFLPLLFGALHTAFALRVLTNLLNVNLNVVWAGAMIGGGYLVAQTAYFLVTRAAYVRQVLR